LYQESLLGSVPNVTHLIVLAKGSKSWPVVLPPLRFFLVPCREVDIENVLGLCKSGPQKWQDPAIGHLQADHCSQTPLSVDKQSSAHLSEHKIVCYWHRYRFKRALSLQIMAGHCPDCPAEAAQRSDPGKGTTSDLCSKYFV